MKSKSHRALQKSSNWTCRHKRKYGNEAQVSLAADSIGMQFYHCPTCGFWHMTKRKQG